MPYHRAVLAYAKNCDHTPAARIHRRHRRDDAGFPRFRTDPRHAVREPHRRQFVDNLLGVFALALFLISLTGVIAAPILVTVLAPGFLDDPDKYDLTVTMLRIVFPYLFFISLVALAAGILNTYGRFGAAAFTPVLLNVCLIGAALWLAPRLDRPVVGLAWGVFIAGAAQLLFPISFLQRLRMLPPPPFPPF